MINRFRYILSASASTLALALALASTLALALAFVSCRNDEPQVSRDTLLMYFPWSSNLQGYFYTNIEDMSSAIVARGGLNDQRVVIYLASSADSATLYELQYDAEAASCRTVRLQTYSHPNYRTADHLVSVFNAVKSHAPALRYAMTIDSHGLGWIPVADYESTRTGLRVPERYRVSDAPVMRLFGDMYGTQMTDITTLANAMKQADFHTQYILFDCCCMANVELAYDLRDVTDYVIASVSEIWGSGMPYKIIGDALLGSPDYEAVCSGYLTHCLSLSYPCGTLSVTACGWMDSLAAFTGRMHGKYDFDESRRSQLQVFDAYAVSIFYDYADYMRHLDLDSTDNAAFTALLGHVVPYSAHTDCYFCAQTRRMYPIHTYCGLTTSNPSTNDLCKHVSNTAWNKACRQ